MVDDRARSHAFILSRSDYQPRITRLNENHKSCTRGDLIKRDQLGGSNPVSVGLLQSRSEVGSIPTRVR